MHTTTSACGRERSAHLQASTDARRHRPHRHGVARRRRRRTQETFRGCDGFGACAEDTVTIAIREDPQDLPPTVRITNPVNGAILTANGDDADGRFHELTLQSDVSDPEGGPVTLVWTDSMDGAPPIEIGTGPSPTVRLRTPCENSQRQLTLTATDNAGNTRQDVVNVTVVTSC